MLSLSLSLSHTAGVILQKLIQAFIGIYKYISIFALKPLCLAGVLSFFFGGGWVEMGGFIEFLATWF